MNTSSLKIKKVNPQATNLLDIFGISQERMNEMEHLINQGDDENMSDAMVRASAIANTPVELAFICVQLGALYQINE